MMASLKVTLPEDVSSTIRFFSVSLCVNAYMTSGFGLARTNSMLSSIFFSCKESTHQMLQRAQGVVAQQEVSEFLTVMIGSSGPNISSVIISASNGGFNNMVGSMNLRSMITDSQMILVLSVDRPTILLRYRGLNKIIM